MCKLIITLSVCVTALWALSEPVVEIKAGKLKGTLRKSYEGKIFSSFEGIPYAKPPLGNLRFKEPQSYSKWNGLWQANTKYTCMQLSVNMIVEGNEDCLYINVYVPRENIQGTENLDVIVHIHSGSFMVGNSYWNMGPEYLMDRDIVFVTFNYRLGVLGFLSTQDDIVPGNNGLKDQTLALKWIQDNIRSLGGNPNSVTLTGLSAGGASVHYHYISPLSKGLFHRGFSQSGTVLNPWALQEAPVEKSKKLASALGCPEEPSDKLLTCLQQRPAEQITNYVTQFYAIHPFPLAPFSPVIEHNHKNAFLPNHPYQLLHKGITNDVPWITSVTTEEGHFPTVFVLEDLNILEDNWSDIVPHMLEFNYTASNTKKKELPEKIKKYYFNSKPVTKENVPLLVNLFSDRLFTIDAEKSARLQAKSAKSPVYFLKMGYTGQHSDIKRATHEKIEGVSHGDDSFFYLFPSFGEAKLSETVEKMKNMYLDMLTNYAKTGNVKMGTVDWKPVTKGEEFVHLFIKDPTNISMEKTMELAPTEFWKSAALRENENIVIIDQKDEL